MENKKTNILTIIAIFVLLVMLVGATYAFFRSQTGGTGNISVTATSSTTDNLSFQISNDISFTASTSNFYLGGNNVSGESTATAILTPNNKTNQATMNYYMYLNLTSNPTVYSEDNTNHDAELILQVFDSNNELVTLTGLGNQVALGSSYGYDITGQTGLITILDNHAIVANNATKTETWRVVITLVNLNMNQNENGGATITGEVIMQKDEMIQSFCDLHPDDLMCYTIANYDTSTYATGTTNLLYYHDENLEDGAEDGSYRYAGSNPNNYVCFGSNSSTCPAENLYRIIGFMPVEVVTDSTTTPVTTETQILYKLIKNTSATSEELNLSIDEGNFDYSNTYYNDDSIDGFYWALQSNDNISWISSKIYTGLVNFVNGFSSTWSNKIANISWKYSTIDNEFLYENIPNTVVFSDEITNAQNSVHSKVGLMYVSDFRYTTIQLHWDNYIYGGISYVWLNSGLWEWTMTQFDEISVYVTWGGTGLGDRTSFGFAYAVRPVFYLTKDTTIDRTLHAGTQADPYRVS